MGTTALAAGATAPSGRPDLDKPLSPLTAIIFGGTVAAGLQMATIRNLALAWVLILPVAMLLPGSLYWLFSKVF